MTKHIEINTIEHKEIAVTYKVDYDNGTATLVEMNPHGKYEPKNWMFRNRSLSYMDGWVNILEAQIVAVKECKKLLGEAYEREEELKKKLAKDLAKKIVA
jgi:hypothetical protein